MGEVYHQLNQVHQSKISYALANVLYCCFRVKIIRLGQKLERSQRLIIVGDDSSELRRYYLVTSSPSDFATRLFMIDKTPTVVMIPAKDSEITQPISSDI
jgi:hypothetical protein